ncbi:MAG: hypothetical protein M1833_000039 [Piccolia ochrophora]|nr:MAG: hypothetical protein M1833_000039 [Piccolia ochrophora]
MSTQPVLADRDVNAPLPSSMTSNPAMGNGGVDGKEGAEKNAASLEFHRQMLKEKLSDDSDKHQYVSPSDGIMSPCTAKLSNLRNKRFMKAKPQSLFAKATAPSSDSDTQVHATQAEDRETETESSAGSKASTP